ncbi:phospholipase D family protein [Gordonia sp. NPDC003504]
MLTPDDRATLLAELKPAPGYAFDHLVTTTFTLDLESALLPCLALAGAARVDAADTVETIAAIESTIDHIDIFHQNGQISVPRHRSTLFSLLENATHGVTPPRGLFHPKLWLAMYQGDDGDVAVKLIVLSRNLTRDRSWDITLTLDGRITTAPRSQNKPIVDLLRYLAGAPSTAMPDNRRERIYALAESIRRAEWDLPSGARELDFHVFGVSGRPQAKPDFSGYKHLVVAPFVEDAGIRRLGEYADNAMAVVSRRDSLNGLSQDMADWIGSAYVLSPTAGIPAEDDEQSSGTTVLTGLHAKLFCVERARLAHLFVGSANATGSAFDRNVEILVELTGSTAVLGVDALIGPDGLGSILDRTQISPGTAPDDEQQHALDAYIRSVASVVLTAELSPNEVSDRYDLRITSDQSVPTFDSDVTMSICLLTDPSTTTALRAGEPVAVHYRGLTLTDITAFLVINVHDSSENSSSTVIKARLVGDLPDRLATVITNEINDPHAFRRFLALLLAFGDDSNESEGAGADDNGHSGRWAQLEQGLFEQLMRASVARPEVLDRLSGVVNTIVAQGDPHRVLPSGFAELWSAIDAATGTRRSTARV